MVRFWQTLFQTVLVFGIGIGLGVAWKSGWIPIEVGPANTGTLSDADSAGNEDSTPSLLPVPVIPGELPPEDPVGSASLPRRPDLPTTASIVRPLIPANPAASANALTDASTVSSATASEPEWAAGPTANRAGSVLARDIRPQASREIRLAANQESAPVANASEADPAPASPAPTASPLADQLADIDRQIATKEILPAHRALSKLYWNQPEFRDEILERLEGTARQIFFEPRPHFVDPYVVQPNDQLRVIAGKYQLSWEYLASLNRTDPKRIQLGQKLKILKGPFAAVVDLSEFSLTVHLQGYFVKRYQVGIGKDGASPIGKFTVLNKVENPQYTGTDGKVISADDPANPLGERWIDLGDSYGIHGTIEPDSIGKAASRGCIRMRTADVIEVYDFLVKGSEVVIRD